MSKDEAMTCKFSTPMYVKNMGWIEAKCRREKGHDGKHQHRYKDQILEW